MNNYAFIDSQNVNFTLRECGWRIDWRKFYIYLKEKHSVKCAYLFLGYLERNERFYQVLKKIGYKVIFKEISTVEGEIKGNIDAELVLQAMIDFKSYDKAVIVTSDGDFSCLVDYLYKNKKLQYVISPNFQKCSLLLRRSARNRVYGMGLLKGRLEYKK
jgi:uncharacterized LabA/DUF88 family protein